MLQVLIANLYPVIGIYYDSQVFVSNSSNLAKLFQFLNHSIFTYIF